MHEVTLVFDNGEESIHVLCKRLQEPAAEVKEGDFIACPFTGFVHVHAVRIEGRTAFLTDCNEHEHIYRAGEVLEIARPVEESWDAH